MNDQVPAPTAPPQIPEILLREQIEHVEITLKMLRRDVLNLSVTLAEQGIAAAESPLRSMHGYLTDAGQIFDALIPKVGAALAKMFAEELPGPVAGGKV